MFGWVNFKIGNVPTRAVLTSTRVWRVSPRPPGVWLDRIGKKLQDIASAYHGPADGFYGPRQVEAAARLLEGEPVLMPIPPHPAGRIY